MYLLLVVMNKLKNYIFYRGLIVISKFHKEAKCTIEVLKVN